MNTAKITHTATVSRRSVGKRTQVPTKRNTAARRVTVTSTVKVRAYPVIVEVLEGGLLAGIRKVFKYVDGDGRVDEDYLIAHADVIMNYLTNGLCEVLDFGDD